MMISTADPDLRGGSRLDLGLGTNLFINKGVLKGTRIGGEFQLPIRQELDGPQLEMDWSLTLGLHFEFK